MTYPQCLLFDLDGTLADTAPDLAAALNQTLIENEQAALDFEVIRPHVSRGGKALIRLGFNLAEQDNGFADLHQSLLIYYQNNLCNKTRLFDGMDEVLAQCESNKLKWGIVTNKPAYLTDPLVELLGLSHRAACVVSGDTLAQRKPDPAPLLHAAKLAGIEATNCVYVGDAHGDIRAAKDAGMIAIAAAYGYLDHDDDPDKWGADHVITSATELLDWCQDAN